MRGLRGPSARIGLAVLLTGLAFYLFLGYRSDYLGHYLAGFGGTLLLLALPPLFRRRLEGPELLAIMLLAVSLGFGTEMTLFKIAKFDPVDFANQSAGACIAGLCLVNQRWEPGRAVRVFAVGALIAAAGVLSAHRC